MRILQINNRFNTASGDSVFFRKNIDLLKSNGYKVDVMYSENGVIKCLDNPEYVSTHGRLHYIFNPFSALFLLRYIYKNGKPDIIHLHIYHGYFTSSIILLARILKIPMVQTMHDMRLICPISSALREGTHCLDCAKSSLLVIINRCRGGLVNSFANWLEWKLDKIIRGNYVKTISVSNWQNEILSNAGGSIDAIVVNFISKVNPKQTFTKVQNQICYVTRLEPDKGIEEFLSLVRMLPSCNFILAGEGSLNSKVKEEALKLENLDFRGVCTQEEVIQIYSESILSLNLSKAFETFGLTVIESLICGTPCIVNPIGNLNFFLQKHSKVILEGKNSEQIISQINNFLNTSIQDQIEIGELARIEGTKYSEKNYMNNIKEVYDRTTRRKIY